jgi:hypothetical protein
MIIKAFTDQLIEVGASINILIVWGEIVCYRVRGVVERQLLQVSTYREALTPRGYRLE